MASDVTSSRLSSFLIGGVLAILGVFVALELGGTEPEEIELAAESIEGQGDPQRVTTELPPSNTDSREREQVAELEPREMVLVDSSTEPSSASLQSSGLHGVVIDGKDDAIESFTIQFVSPSHVISTRGYGPDGGGRFAFDTEEPGRWILKASAEGFLSTQVDCHFPRVEPVVLRLQKSGEIIVSVLNSLGEPAGQARVRLTSEGESVRYGSATGLTDSLGGVRLAPLEKRSYQVVANSGVYGYGFHEEVVLTDAEPSARVEIRLSPGGEVRGTVFGIRGVTLEKLPLRIRRMPQDADDPFANYSRRRRSKGDGTFEFAGLPPGDYLISTDSVSLGGISYPVKKIEARVRERQTTLVDLHLAEVSGILVKARVVHRNEPLHGAYGSVYVRGGHDQDGYRNVTSDESGEFEVVLERAGSWNFDLGVLRASGMNASIQMVADIPEVTEYELLLELPAGGISGHVVDAEGVGVPGIRVSAESRYVGNRRNLSARSVTESAEDGSFDLEFLPPGPCRVSARGTVQFDTHRVLRKAPAVDVDVTSTNSFVNVVLRLEDRKLGSISGTLVDEAGEVVTGATIQHRPLDPKLEMLGWRYSIDDMGGYQIVDLVTGSWMVQAHQGKRVSTWTQVDVRAGANSRADLVLRPGSMLDVTVTSAETERVLVSVVDSSGLELSGGRRNGDTWSYGPILPGTYQVFARRILRHDTGIEITGEVQQAVTVEENGDHHVTLEMD